MKKLLEFLVKSIVPHPKDVVVTKKEENGFVTFQVKAHPDDLKIIIGKKGRTIKALRELVRIKAFQEKKRVDIQVGEQKPNPKG